MPLMAIVSWGLEKKKNHLSLTYTQQILSVRAFHYAKFRSEDFQMGRFVSVRSGWNIRDHLRRVVHFDRSDRRSSLTNRSRHCHRHFPR